MHNANWSSYECMLSNAGTASCSVFPTRNSQRSAQQILRG
jgi:hypothetical protein